MGEACERQNLGCDILWMGHGKPLMKISQGACLTSPLASPRTLCDNLRRERDRAVSELAEALRGLDDTRKQKNDISRELKELKYVGPGVSG